MIARRSLRGPIRPVLDWFHVAMRLQHLRQFSQGLTTQLPSHAAAKRMIRRGDAAEAGSESSVRLVMAHQLIEARHEQFGNR
jgi:hypothetical protein